MCARPSEPYSTPSAPTASTTALKIPYSPVDAAVSSYPLRPSRAASAAHALVAHVRALNPPGKPLPGLAVCSRGEYGMPRGIWAGLPVRTSAPGVFVVVEGIEHDSFARNALEKTGAELRAMMPWIGANKLVDTQKN